MTTVQFPLSLSCAAESTNRRLRYMPREVPAPCWLWRVSEYSLGNETAPDSHVLLIAELGTLWIVHACQNLWRYAPVQASSLLLTFRPHGGVSDFYDRFTQMDSESIWCNSKVISLRQLESSTCLKFWRMFFVLQTALWVTVKIKIKDI